MKFKLHAEETIIRKSTAANISVNSNRSYTENWTTVTDVDSKSKIVYYGSDNCHPSRLKDALNDSLNHLKIVQVASNIIAGDITHTGKESAVEEAKVFYKDAFIDKNIETIAFYLYAFGYCPLLLNFSGKNGGKDYNLKVALREPWKFRLGVHYEDFFGKSPQHHFFGDKIEKCRQNLGGHKVKTPKTYFNTKNKDKCILKAPVFEKENHKYNRYGVYSHLIGLKKSTNEYYPKPFFENKIFWQRINSEYELVMLERNSIKNGLSADAIVTVYRQMYENPVGDDESLRQREEDRDYIENELLGVKNAGTIHVQYRSNSFNGDAVKGEGDMEVTKLPSNNNHKEIASRGGAIKRSIQTCHALTISELIGQDSDKSSGFSSLAEYMTTMIDVWIKNVLQLHINPINEFFATINSVMKLNVKTKLTPKKLASKMLAGLFKDVLTKNELRAVAGYVALEDENDNDLRKDT